MRDSFRKKVIFDVEVMPHLFVLAVKPFDGFDPCGETESAHTPMEAYRLIQETSDYLWVGYYSNGYDDYIMSAIIDSMGTITPEELYEISKRLIEDGEHAARKSFMSYDCFDPIEAGMRSLKMFCGSSGRSTYDSPYSFKDDMHYNDEQIADIEAYCREDVDYTAEVFCNEREFYEASLARVDILRNAGVEPDNILKVICCRSAAFGRYLFQSLCGERDRRDNMRTTIKFVRDYANSPYEEVRSAFSFYNSIKEDGDETSNAIAFYKDVETPSFPKFTEDMGIELGWGGAHGAISGYKFESNPERALLYVDVSSMYPTLLIKHDLFPHTFTDSARYVYNFAYEARLKYKYEGDAIKSQACKRIIASLTGMLKDKFATFRSEWSNNSIVVNGQLSILDMACRLRAQNDSWKLVQVNTDGVMVEVNNTQADRDAFKSIVDQWCSDYIYEVSSKEIDRLIQTNVNNYYMRLTNGKEDLKGAAYSYNELYFRDKVCVKKALPHCLTTGESPKEYLARSIESGELTIKDFFILIKVTDTFPYLWDVMSNEYKEARCIRVIAVKNNLEKVLTNGLDMCYYMKTRRRGSTEAQKVTNFPENAVELPADIAVYNESALFDLLDLDYYASLIERAINIFYKGE